MIKYSYETGILECVDTLENVHNYIKDHMGRLTRIHNNSTSQASENPFIDATRRNTNIARMKGIHTIQEWKEALRKHTVMPWHIYTTDNNKVIPQPEGLKDEI